MGTGRAWHVWLLTCRLVQLSLLVLLWRALTDYIFFFTHAFYFSCEASFIDTSDLIGANSRWERTRKEMISVTGLS